MKKIALLGATGSIGCQTLAVIRAYPEKFSATALIANGNANLLAKQIREFSPPFAALRDPVAARQLRQIFPAGKPQIFSGESGIEQCLTECGADMCVSAAGGVAGLRPTLTAIDCRMQIALANKETLVAAGQLVMAKARQNKVEIFPIDSEHSALAQCLLAGKRENVRRVFITSSGGALYHLPDKPLDQITPADALKHPTWAMGKKITIDSATLANKALEAVEAHFLFELAYDQIEILIHPQSILHGAVEFADGSLIAQLAIPDMRLPILYALNGGVRDNSAAAGVKPLSLTQFANLTFAAPDEEKFPLLRLGLAAGRAAGLAAAIYSAANEIAVELFLAEKIRYPQIAELVADALEKIPAAAPHFSLEKIIAADQTARAHVIAAAKNLKK